MKKLSAIILSLVMLLSTFAVSASAAVYTEREEFRFWYPNFWRADGTLNFGVEPGGDPADWAYVEKDEAFAQRKAELEQWMSEECSALFILDGEPTFSQVFKELEGSVPIPANYWLYDYDDAEIRRFNGFKLAEKIRDKYIDLMGMKSINATLEDLDVWETEAKEMLTDSDVTAADVEKIVKAAGTGEYYPSELYSTFKDIEKKCYASADPDTGEIHAGLYINLYSAFRDLCIESGRMYGDMNCDGEITALDATIVLQAVAGLVELDAHQRCALNDQFTAITATELLQVTAGLRGDFVRGDSCYYCPAKLFY